MLYVHEIVQVHVLQKWYQISARECTRSNLRESKMQKFPGGACPQTPLGIVPCAYVHVIMALPPCSHTYFDRPPLGNFLNEGLTIVTLSW
jgi:hypothetical protein